MTLTLITLALLVREFGRIAQEAWTDIRQRAQNRRRARMLRKKHEEYNRALGWGKTPRKSWAASLWDGLS